VLSLLESLARQGTAVVVASPQLPAGGARDHRVVEIEAGKLTRDTPRGVKEP